MTMRVLDLDKALHDYMGLRVGMEVIVHVLESNEPALALRVAKVCVANCEDDDDTLPKGEREAVAKDLAEFMLRQTLADSTPEGRA
jgi:hypothetical protein